MGIKGWRVVDLLYDTVSTRERLNCFEMENTTSEAKLHESCGETFAG